MILYTFKEFKKIFPKEKRAHRINTTRDIEKIIKDKKEEIIIYDKTYNKDKKEKNIEAVKNHINKSGTNPLLIKKEKEIKFYDITKIYYNKKGGITTTCLGNKYEKEKKKHPNPSTFLAYIAMVLHIKGYKKIKGRLINLID